MTTCCPSSPATPPDIHYLARDYDGFRQAMLDRMAVLLPGWSETHAADPGITLSEALAYTADRISYLQDAVNTEAVYRHGPKPHFAPAACAAGRLLGAGRRNARAWVCMTATMDGVTVPADTQIFPHFPGLPPRSAPTATPPISRASSGRVFESLADLVLHPEQNQMDFYTWGKTANAAFPPVRRRRL